MTKKKQTFTQPEDPIVPLCDRCKVWIAIHTQTHTKTRTQTDRQTSLSIGFAAHGRGLHIHLEPLSEAVALRHHPAQVGQRLVPLQLHSLQDGLGRHRGPGGLGRLHHLSPQSLQLAVCLAERKQAVDNVKTWNNP